jgi:hypothetical protein
MHDGIGRNPADQEAVGRGSDLGKRDPPEGHVMLPSEAVTRKEQADHTEGNGSAKFMASLTIDQPPQ